MGPPKYRYVCMNLSMNLNLNEVKCEKGHVYVEKDGCSVDPIL